MPLPLKILVADDSPTNVMQVQAVARKLGHTVVRAADGVDAVAQFLADPPDLVFMDIMMPRMDGLAATRRIRELSGARWIPIILFSALDSITDVVNGLDTGADDYLSKPVDLLLLRAKINRYAQMVALQKQLQDSVVELKAWREEAAEQNRLGHFVINRLVHGDGLRDPILRAKSIPARTFSGDLICAERAPGDVLYLMLADAVGHGLPAALTALPLTQVFYGMARKGFPIHTIAEELNRKLKAIMPVDRFVATTLAAVDTANQNIEIWNGGNPDVLLIAADGSIQHRWVSHHPPLGILPDAEFSSLTECIHYLHPGELILISDGVIEAESPDGRRLNQQELESLLCASGPGHRFADLAAGLASHLAGREDHDDISWVVVKATIERRPEVRVAAPAAACHGKVSEWRMEFTWGAAELRQIDVVPAVLAFMAQISILKAHQGTLFVIVSELFNNALDHGVLCLSSGIKNQPGGLERYLELRAERLASLDNGQIDMGFHLHLAEGQPVLDISLTDSGMGFDYTPYLDLVNDVDGHSSVHGRGIKLVKSLCPDLSYAAAGNQVRVRYRL